MLVRESQGFEAVIETTLWNNMLGTSFSSDSANLIIAGIHLGFAEYILIFSSVWGTIMILGTIFSGIVGLFRRAR